MVSPGSNEGSMSEQSEVTAPIIAALEEAGIVAWRQQAGVVQVRRGWMHLAPAGTPDIVGFLPGGRFFGIEAKLAGNRTSRDRGEKQAAWGARCVAQGGLYILARTVAEAFAGLGLLPARNRAETAMPATKSENAAQHKGAKQALAITHARDSAAKGEA